MAIFPNRIYNNAGEYLDAYALEIGRAFASVDRKAVQRAAECLQSVIEDGGSLYSCGNGGSASISNHLVCDYTKGAQTDTNIKPRVVSLVSNIEIVTAIANDMTYDDVFVYQLTSLAKAGDVLIGISSSGNSPNVCKALNWARANGLRTIAMTGFEGGEASRLAEISLHVRAQNYGIAEDVHQSLMHLFAQYLRQKNLTNPSLIGHRKF